MSKQQNQSYSLQAPLISRTYGTGKVLVLLHGWGLNSGAWHSVIPEISKKYQVVTIDLPGFGENAANFPDEYSLSNLAHRVAALIPNNSVLLGWSMGGLIAQKIAIDNDITLSGLITLASTPCFEQKADWHGIKPNVLRLFEQQLEQDYAQTLSRFLAIQALGSPSARADVKQLKQAISAYPTPAISALRSGLQLLSSVDLRCDIGEIDIPTLRMYGRLDSLVPVDGIERIHQLQPSAQQFLFQHAAHAPFISHPHDWLNAIDTFISPL